MDVGDSDKAAALPEPEATGNDTSVVNDRNVPLHVECNELL